jgi:hypothetical protein
VQRSQKRPPTPTKPLPDATKKKTAPPRLTFRLEGIKEPLAPKRTRNGESKAEQKQLACVVWFSENQILKEDDG